MCLQNSLNIVRCALVLNVNADNDECTMGTNNCHANAECTNTPGSFSCDCVQGYSGDGVDCIGMHVAVLILK